MMMMMVQVFQFDKVGFEKKASSHIYANLLLKRAHRIFFPSGYFQAFTDHNFDSGWIKMLSEMFCLQYNQTSDNRAQNGSAKWPRRGPTCQGLLGLVLKKTASISNSKLEM